MKIVDARNEKVIEIGTDLSIIDKIVVYEEVGEDEVALVECRVFKDSTMSTLGLGVELGCRRVSDEWLELCEGKISEVLDYFEKRDKVKDEKEYMVVFDSANLPKWFDGMVKQGNYKAVKLYELLVDLGIKS